MRASLHFTNRPLRRMLGGVLILALLLPATLAAQAISQPAFQSLWERTDRPVQQGRGRHSWIWGPGPFTPELSEWYVEGPGGSRPVQYFDKGRMELNDPSADPANPWYVTGGLLTRDMIDGRVQVGNNDFVFLDPAPIPVAGDPDAGFPTYADLRPYVRAPIQLHVGDYVAERLTPEGRVAAPEFASLAAAQITYQVYWGYSIPRAFWDFLTQSGVSYRDGRYVQATPLFDWLYVAGYPIADAFWVRVPVGGVMRDVMVQPFERRVLTYTPANPARFQVELGNVGRHYYRWRYELPFADGRQALITAPPRDSIVSSPLAVQGFERGILYENDMTVRLRTAAGQVLTTTSTGAHRPDLGIPGPFVTSLVFAPPATTTPGSIEAVTTSAIDGSEGVIASLPVTILGQASALDRAVGLAREDLAARTRVWPERIGVHAAEAVAWPDSALGCPAPGQGAPPLITPGFRVVLEAAGQQYDYHTDTGDQLLLCQDGLPLGPIGAPLSLPVPGAVSTLPLHSEARLGQPGAPVSLELALENGGSLRSAATLLAAPDGTGLLLASIWASPDPPRLASQRAVLQIRDPQGQLLAARLITVLGPTDPLVRPVELSWLSGEQPQVEQRLIPRTPQIGTATLEELLWGPPPGSSLTTAIPTPEEVLRYPGREADWGARVRLLGLVIHDGVATADFSQELRAYGGGSARVGAIRQQISRTLLQFPSVREVRIAIEGQTEGVLEP